MFLLGGGASGFLAHGDGDLYLGGAVDLTFVAIAGDGRSGSECARGRRQNDCHASHHRFYAEFEILDALDSDDPSLFTYGAGYSASFEVYLGYRVVPVELEGLSGPTATLRAIVNPF